MLKLYLGVCCLNRLFDDQRQERVRLETEAITLIHCCPKQNVMALGFVGSTGFIGTGAAISD